MDSVNANYAEFAAGVQQLARVLAGLQPLAEGIGVSPAAGQEWYELLQKKLLPQLDLPPLLVVAVVGGTNIGKSVIFNHLAGEMASAVSPLAAGTKHPVCLVPPGLDDPDLLRRLFEPFVLHAWSSADDPLSDTPENCLFWRPGRNMPPRLLVLDAPDVDSDADMNWQRARAIRQTADVLVAVLTQQKYNDAAVKQFFRAAVEAGKPIVVVFNQVDLKADRNYWPQWLATFCGSTGAQPELVYVIPYDRAAADKLRLPFYSVGPDGRRPPDRRACLRDDLGALHFDAIKVRTFRGALGQVLDPQHGAPAYLARVRGAGDQFASAAAVLSASEMARVSWPTLPTAVLVDEIRNWWDAARAPWSRQVHGFYRVLGRGVTWPIRAAWDRVSGPRVDPLESFHRQERAAIITAVEKLFDELTRLAEVGNETLRPRLAKLLGGHARASLLARVQESHEALPAVDEDYREFFRTELEGWRKANPRAVRFLQSLDHAAAIARPAITITLFFTGLHLAGDFVGQAAVQAAGHTAGQLATEAAIAGGITGGGEALVTTTSEGVRQAAARLFGRLQARYAQQRAAWLAAWLERELLGDLLGDLRHGADVPQSPAFHKVEAALAHLQALWAGTQTTL